MNNFQQMLKQAQLAQKKHQNFKKEVFTTSNQKNLINNEVIAKVKAEENKILNI